MTDVLIVDKQVQILPAGQLPWETGEGGGDESGSCSLCCSIG